MDGYYVGNCLDLLRAVPDGSVNCCVTSPPYWGLRSYLDKDDPAKPLEIGQERTPAEYVEVLVEVFRDVKRVLRSDGTVWLNLADTFCSNGGHADNACNDRRGGYNIGNRPEHDYREFRCKPSGLFKAKDLMLLPARVAIALHEDGWWIRSEVIWEKPNAMPSSVKDRPSFSHEHLFLLSKSATYYYDAAAIVEPAVGSNAHDLTGPGYKAPGQTNQKGNRGKNEESRGSPSRWFQCPLGSKGGGGASSCN